MCQPLWASISLAIRGEAKQHLPLRALVKISSFLDSASGSFIAVSVSYTRTEIRMRDLRRPSTKMVVKVEEKACPGLAFPGL